MYLFAAYLRGCICSRCPPCGSLLGMTDDDALQALLDMPVTPAQLAESGHTVTEIAAQLGMSQAEAAAAMGSITPAQLDRIEQVALARAVGIGDSLPHVQAAQFLLGSHRPSVYGRQAGQAGTTTLRVILDRDFKLRDARRDLEGEVVHVLEHAKT